MRLSLILAATFFGTGVAVAQQWWQDGYPEWGILTAFFQLMATVMAVRYWWVVRVSTRSSAPRTGPASSGSPRKDPPSRR